MVKLTGSFGRLKSSHILVAGDVLQDTYTVGKARRISPEAPVPVIDVQREERRPGGAGNVVLNLLALGSSVSALGRVGSDPVGQELLYDFAAKGVNCLGLVTQKGYATPVKNRVIADHQQIVRIDREVCTPLPSQLAQEIARQLPALLETVEVIALSDYGKGFLTDELLSYLIKEAKRRGIPVITDPKGVEFSKYSGSTLIKPNFVETMAAAGLGLDASLEEAAKKILAATGAKTVMVTRAEQGISLFFQEAHPEHYPVAIREVKDVTGAGDTVLAMVACSLASGLSLQETCQLANVAAGIAIERFGCARVSLSDIARRLLEEDTASKIFDEEHLFALKQALEGRKVAVVGLQAEDGLKPQVFALLRKLRQRERWATLIYMRDASADADCVEIFASLHEVDFIILKSASLHHLCANIAPHEVYVADYGTVRKAKQMGDLALV